MNDMLGGLLTYKLKVSRISSSDGVQPFHSTRLQCELSRVGCCCNTAQPPHTPHPHVSVVAALQGEDVVRDSGVPFVVVRPTALTEEDAGAEVVVDQGDTIKVTPFGVPPLHAEAAVRCVRRRSTACGGHARALPSLRVRKRQRDGAQGCMSHGPSEDSM